MLAKNGAVSISVTIKNTSARAGDGGSSSSTSARRCSGR
jgi:hypothetical protein